MDRSKVIFCFAAIYIIWGSTYLAILYGLESIPPWAMSSLRFFFAGLIMWALSRWKKESELLPKEKKIARMTGALLVMANGLVCVVEQWVPSGLAAVVIGAMPIWMMLVTWLGFRGDQPTLRKWMGALVGLAGIILIASERGVEGTRGPLVISILLLITSNLIWATGTLLQRKLGGLKSPMAFSQVQMLWGSLATLVLSLIFEAPWRISWLQISTHSILALIYLITFGSVIGYTAYAWLARNVEPHKISTYALVNPVIAVFLGWMFKSEMISSRFILATVFVLAGLAILFWRRTRPAIKP